MSSRPDVKIDLTAHCLSEQVHVKLKLLDELGVRIRLLGCKPELLTGSDSSLHSCHSYFKFIIKYLRQNSIKIIQSILVD